MTEPITLDQRIAQRLGTHPDQIRQIREAWQQTLDGNVIRAIHEDKLTAQISERVTKLKKADLDTFKQIQGEIAGLEMALSLTTAKEIENK